MANPADNLQLQQISESALTTRSATARLGVLARIDRILRRFVPGYNYLRGKRGGSRTSLAARGVSSGFIVSAKIRARLPNANANANRPPPRPATIENVSNVFLETGISKVEFCSKLDHILRRKLLEQQKDPEDEEDDPEEILLEAIEVQNVEEEQTEGTQEDGIEMEDVQMAQPGEVQTGND